MKLYMCNNILYNIKINIKDNWISRGESFSNRGENSVESGPI